MPACPRCDCDLVNIRGKQGILMGCPECKSCAITIVLLRKLIPEDLANKLWQSFRMNEHPLGHKCPACTLAMSEVPLTYNRTDTILIDVCGRCQLIWFDPKEFEALPWVQETKPTDNELTPETREKIALALCELESNKINPTQGNNLLGLVMELILRGISVFFR